MEIALARGKKEYDKRNALRERQENREAQAAMSLRKHVMSRAAARRGQARAPRSRPRWPSGSARCWRCAAPAAADSQDVVTAFDETITLDADGTAHVVIDLTMDFGSSPNHGPYLTYPVKQHYDATYDRIYRFSHIRAQSADAPADVDVQDENGWNQIRIGDPDRTVTGSHTYRISYDVDGWVNPADYPFPKGPLDHDELYLNAIGDRWTMPLDNVSVTVVGPAAVTDATCYTGPTGSTTPCDAVNADGATVDLPPAAALAPVSR